MVHCALRLIIKSNFANKTSVDKFLSNEARKGPYKIPKKILTNFSVSFLPGAKCPTHVISTKDNESEFTIFFYHGGAYVANFMDEHISAITAVLQGVGKCTAIIPEYPLAPNSTHEQIFDEVEAVYRQVVAQGVTKVALLGDSAGGGIALVLAQRLASAKKAGDSVRQPDSVILLSPWLDVSMTNPEVQKLNSLDPILDIYGLTRFGELLAAGPQPVSTKDPKVSPLFGSLEDLPPISVWTSTHDLLSPDSRALQSRFENEKILSPFRFVYEQFLVHDWWLFGGPDATRTIQQIVAAIKEDCAAEKE